MKNSKWGVEAKSQANLHVVLFVSRHKDNIVVRDYKERRMAFVTQEEPDSDQLMKKFHEFVNEGVPGELSRMYYSVNTRDESKVYNHLMHFLLDNPTFDLSALPAKIAGLAAEKECALTKKWMFDFDLDNESAMRDFCSEMLKIDSTLKPRSYKTPHGYALIVDHGFDCRELLEKYTYVTLKRDDLLCVSWSRCIF